MNVMAHLFYLNIINLRLLSLFVNPELIYAGHMGIALLLWLCHEQTDIACIDRLCQLT